MIAYYIHIHVCRCRHSLSPGLITRQDSRVMPVTVDDIQVQSCEVTVAMLYAHVEWTDLRAYGPFGMFHMYV